MADINLYAEVLQNIGQITLYASFQTDKNEGTTVDISSDRRFISVTHDGTTAQLLLPLAVSGTAQVTIPAERAKDVSLRLALEDTNAVTTRFEDLGSEEPWSAAKFTPSGRLRCLNCERPVTRSDAIFTWKDLPSENWAEMMDFWHCHRPHDEDKPSTGNENEAAQAKGYGAANRVRATKGTAFVDVSSFLLSKEDCIDLKAVDARLPNGHREIHCSFCENLTGFEDEHTGGWRLYKWSLAAQLTASTSWQSYKLELHISAILLSLIESQMTRKFVIHAGSHCGKKDGLLIWIFNPDLKYSSSRRPSDDAYTAMKVFYITITDPLKMLEDNATSLEELFLPASVLEELEKLLKQSTDILPLVARKFQQWQVGLLERFNN